MAFPFSNQRFNFRFTLFLKGDTGWSTGPRLPTTSSLPNFRALVCWTTYPCAHILTRSCSKRSTNRFRLRHWHHWKSWVKLGALTLFLVQKVFISCDLKPHHLGIVSIPSCLYHFRKTSHVFNRNRTYFLIYWMICNNHQRMSKMMDFIIWTQRQTTDEPTKVSLRAEMAGLYPVAMTMMVSETLGEVDAWARAILRERQLCGKHACSSATKIIVRALAWSFSTSDVERLFHGSGSFLFG